MRKIDLGQTITILANIGVIAGIVFLAFELRQNNDLMETQGRADRRAIAKEAGLRLLNNPELRRATISARRGEDLTEDERMLLEIEHRQKLGDWRYIVQEVQAGAMEERELHSGLINGWRDTFYNEDLGMAEFWPRFAENSDPSFVAWMEENVIVR